ncbi:MAG: hypothetical protein ACT4OS_08235 [Acidimicrobiales bacterium]
MTGPKGWGGKGEQPVTPDDIAAKLRALAGTVSSGTEGVRDSAAAGAGTAAVALVALTYVLGRRRGRRRSTVVEIRRL